MDWCGIDFGTSNSALAFNNLFISEPSVIFIPNSGSVCVGKHAINTYVELGGAGRFIQSCKQFLNDSSFTRTQIGFKFYTLPDLIAIVLQPLVKHLKKNYGNVQGVVFGLPAIYAHIEETLVKERMKVVAQKLGFSNVEFVYEPVAASLAYNNVVTTQDKTLLVADFGGGTSDFVIIQNGKVLAVNGIYVGGDIITAEIAWQKLGHYFGKNGTWLGSRQQKLPIPDAFIRKFTEWHKVPFMNALDFQNNLHTFTSLNKEFGKQLKLYERLINDNKVFRLWQLVDQAKCSLGNTSSTTIHMEEYNIYETLNKDELPTIIKDLLIQIGECITQTIQQANLNETDIDAVITTGGTSQLWSIQDLLQNIFGKTKVHSYNVFKSVAQGLMLHAKTK